MEKPISKEKQQFSNLFLFVVLLLMTLPFFISSQELVTKLLDLTGLSYLIQTFIIPVEVKFVIVILHFLGLAATGDNRIILLQGSVNSYRAQIIWSCIGWQSLLLLGVTLVSGLSAKYTTPSRVEAVLIGVFGTFWVNILRIVLIYLIGFNFGENAANFFHNLIGTLITLAWVFLFWWLVYKFILEEEKLTDR